VINPNISEDVTTVMADEARRSASAGTEIVATTARFGALYIENRAEAAIASHAVLDALAEHGAGADAAIVSASGDPGLGAARECADRIPVPTLDGVSCAVRLAEALVGLTPRPPQRGSFARPPAKPNRGLSDALGAVIDPRRPS